MLKATLHTACVGVIKQVKKRPSMVSCAAIATLSEMCACIQRAMDDMVEETAPHPDAESV